MKQTIMDLEGNILPDDTRIEPDHVVQDFTVTIESLNGASVAVVQSLLEEKFKVRGARENTRLIIGRKTSD